jgi:hypothetical protein
MVSNGAERGIETERRAHGVRIMSGYVHCIVACFALQ